MFALRCRLGSLFCVAIERQKEGDQIGWKKQKTGKFLTTTSHLHVGAFVAMHGSYHPPL